MSGVRKRLAQVLTPPNELRPVYANRRRVSKVGPSGCDLERQGPILKLLNGRIKADLASHT